MAKKPMMKGAPPFAKPGAKPDPVAKGFPMGKKAGKK